MVEIRIAPSRRRHRIGQSRHMNQTRERLRGRSYAEIVFVGTRFSHPGNLQIDERGIDLAERVVTEFPTLHLPRTVVFAEHRGLGDQTLEEFAALRKAQIERDSVLAGAEVVEQATAIETIGLSARHPRTKRTEHVERALIVPFDAERYGAHRREHPRRVGPRNDLGHVDYAYPFERTPPGGFEFRHPDFASPHNRACQCSSRESRSPEMMRSG